VESLPDPVVRFSPEGRLLYVNAAYCEVTGKRREELEGSIFMPVTEERYADAIATQMTKLFRPPYACIVEQWIQTPKGKRCISWSAKSIMDEGKSVTSIVASGRDITRQKLDKKSFRKHDDDLLVLIESSPQMYYTHSIDHVITFASPRIRSLLKCTGRPKKAWTDYLTDNPVNAQGLEKTIKAITSGRRVAPYRLEMARADGTTIWVEVNEVPVVKNGKTVAIAGSLLDITERMYIEEGNTEAEALFRESAQRKKEAEAEEARSRFGFFKSVFSKTGDDDDDEFAFDIPKGLN